MKIASLLPAATEIVEHLGRDADLVAVSHACKPRDASLPRLTRSRVPLDLDAQQTDAEVKELLARGEPLFELDENLLCSLQPDVLLAQSLCNVCAIDGNHVMRVLQTLGDKTKLLEWSPTTLRDVTAGIEQIGRFINADEEGRTAATSMQRQLNSIRNDTARNSNPPTVVFLEWLNPMFCAGHWIPELVTIAGGRELLGQAGGRSREIQPEDLIAADPDVIVACCCGWPADRTQGELNRVANEKWWNDLRAVRSGRVHVLDAESAFTMPGPGLVEDCRRLAELLQAEPAVVAHSATLTALA